jgi:uncharacterized protein YegP (UPF0339 family)
MSSSHQSDDYNLSQKSQSSKAGFESFKGEDGRYYFHFNDQAGTALLFSQAYIKTAERDVGIKSVQKNAVIKARYETINEGDKHYFVLRAGNNFAIGRSRFFKNKAEMEAQKQFLNTYFASEIDDKKELVAQVASTRSILTTTEPSIESISTLKNAENEALKNRIKDLEKKIEQLEKSKNDISDVEKTELPRQIFRIEMYKNDKSSRFHGKIIHPLTTETRIFSGVDVQTIEEFINEKIDTKTAVGSSSETEILPNSQTETLPNSLAEFKIKSANEFISKSTTEPAPNSATESIPKQMEPEVQGGISQIKAVDDAPNEVSSAVSVEKQKPDVVKIGKMRIEAHSLANANSGILQESPFELTGYPDLKMGENLRDCEQYLMKVYVFSFATREHFMLLERNISFDGNAHNSLKTRVHPNALPKGSHRLTVMISEPNQHVNPALKYYEGKTWHGEAIIQVH